MKAAGTWQTRQEVPRAASRPKRKRGRMGAGSALGVLVSEEEVEEKKLSEEEEAWRRGKVWRVLMGCRPELRRACGACLKVGWSWCWVPGREE
jgi:hypothetical protein